MKKREEILHEWMRQTDQRCIKEGHLLATYGAMEEYAALKVSEQFISKAEVLEIDKRIDECYIEPKEYVDDTFYVRIEFNYTLDGVNVISDGRHEFESKSKEELLKQIKTFMKEEYPQWDYTTI